MLKKITVLIAAFAFAITGCKKAQNIPVEEQELNIIKSYVHEKVNKKEFNAINWSDFKKSTLKDNTNAYRFLYKNDKKNWLSVYYNKKIELAQIFKYDIVDSVFSCTLENLETSEIKSKSIPVSEILSPNSSKNYTPPTITPTLPWVVVIGYLPNNGSSNLMLTIFTLGQFGNSNNNGSGVVEEIQPENTGGGEAIADFQTLAEAQAFLTFIESLNSLESAILAQFPHLAVPYYLNSKTALEKSIAWANSQCSTSACVSSLLNDGKADAIRHAYWNALNKSDMGNDFATALASAHEYGATKPANVSQTFWDLQRTMDLNNNIVGRNFTYTLLNSDDTIWSKFIEEVNTGGNQTIGLVYICAANGAGNETLKLFSQTCP